MRFFTAVSVFSLYLLFFLSCSHSPDANQPEIEAVEIDDVSVLLSAAEDDWMARPFSLFETDESLYLYDNGLNQIVRLGPGGEPMQEFGREGEGPGEFRFIAGHWAFQDTLVLYDRPGGKVIHLHTDGTHIADYSIDAGSLTLSLAALSPHKLILPASSDSLLTFTDLRDVESTFSFGRAFADTDGSIDIQQAQSDAAAGRVPAFLQNQVLLSANRSGIFLFQQATAQLQKYSHSGQLIWEKSLRLPATEGVFEQFVENNKTLADMGRPNLLMLHFAHEIQATEAGIAVLMNTTEAHPVTIAHVSNDGKLFKTVTFPTLQNETKPNRFWVSLPQKAVYMLHVAGGDIYRAPFPI
ncbi:MAG: hypothetical protein ACNA78_00745 [Balneolaceae bacterium]